MVKAMLVTGLYNDQGILAYFTRPTRTINHREIAEVRTGARHRLARAATPQQLADFLLVWPDVDSDTGLSNRGDELLVKAREAMIAAVHTFNAAGLTFRAEIFITTAIIAWTYLAACVVQKGRRRLSPSRRKQRRPDAQWGREILGAWPMPLPPALSGPGGCTVRSRIPARDPAQGRASLDRSDRRRSKRQASGMLHQLQRNDPTDVWRAVWP